MDIIAEAVSHPLDALDEIGAERPAVVGEDARLVLRLLRLARERFPLQARYIN